MEWGFRGRCRDHPPPPQGNVEERPGGSKGVAGGGAGLGSLHLTPVTQVNRLYAVPLCAGEVAVTDGLPLLPVRESSQV